MSPFRGHDQELRFVHVFSFNIVCISTAPFPTYANPIVNMEPEMRNDSGNQFFQNRLGNGNSLVGLCTGRVLTFVDDSIATFLDFLDLCQELLGYSRTFVAREIDPAVFCNNFGE